jgi:hypothetical protein
LNQQFCDEFDPIHHLAIILELNLKTWMKD